MKNASCFPLALAAMLIPVSWTWAAELDWHTYTSAAGQFSVEFPGEVTLKPGTTVQAVCTLRDPLLDLRASYTDRPFRDANAAEAFRELDRIRTAGCEQAGVTPQHVQKFTFAGRPACVFDFTQQAGEARVYFRQWFILDGARFYQLQYMYAAGDPQQDAGEHFFRSFRITR
jgi:hypothetical protein